jgi:hypothetical protein
MMRTGRSGDRQSPLRVVRVTARETDWEPNPRTASRPAAIRAASMGRTYDRNRPTRINNQKLLPEGGVHIRLLVEGCSLPSLSAKPGAGP